MPATVRFDLSAHIVAAGVEERERARVRQSALHSIPTRPLIAPSTAQYQHATNTLPTRYQHATNSPKLSLRFTPGSRERAGNGTHLLVSDGVDCSVEIARMERDRERVGIGNGPGTGLTFSSLMASTAISSASLVERLSPQPLSNIAGGFRRRIEQASSTNEECEYIDQYSVYNPDEKDGCERCIAVAYATTCVNVPKEAERGQDGVVRLTSQGKKFSSLLGLTGHIERASVRTHIFASVLFVVYGVCRTFVLDTTSTSGVLVSFAAFTAAFTFASSSIYHATSPDRELSACTRILDYLGIYLGIVVTALADISVVTKGFRNVPWVAILDVPIGAVAISLFFVWRRVRIPRHVTWQPEKSKCGLERGLYQLGHFDFHHSSLRESTTFLLALAYFMVVPAAIAVLGSETALVVLVLQGSAFLLLVFGMVLDRVLGWPDDSLAEGRLKWLACKLCDCVLNKHAIWHIIALLAASLGVFAREFALASV